MKTATLTAYEMFGCKGRKALMAQHQGRVVHEILDYHAPEQLEELLSVLGVLGFTHYLWASTTARRPIPLPEAQSA